MKGLIVATDGFEDSEFSYPYYRLQEAGWEVDVVTPEGREIEGEYGYTFEGDWSFDDHEPSWWAEEYDALVIPGGRSPERLRTEAPSAADLVFEFDERDKPIAAICHGSQLLISADVLAGRRATGYWTLEVDIENAGGEYVDEEVVVDGNLYTSRVPEDLPAFMGSLFEAFEKEPAAPTA